MKQNKTQKLLQRVFCLLALAPALTVPAFAATNIGQNVADYGLDLLWWVALLVIAAVAVQLFFKRNYVGILITAIVGGLLLFIIKNPQQLEVFGEMFWNILHRGKSA